VKRLYSRLLAIPTPVLFLGSVCVAVCLLWFQGSIREIGPAIRSASWITILAAFLLYAIGLMVLCLRWHVLVKMVNEDSNILPASEAFVTSVAINYAAPLSLALPSRAFLTMRALGLSAGQTTALTFWETAADLMVLAALSAIWILIGGWRGEGLPGDERMVIVALALVVVGVIAIAISIWLVGRLRSIWIRVRNQMVVGLSFPAKRPRQAAIAGLLTLLFWLIQAGVMSVLMYAITGERAASSLILGLISLPILIGMISPVPGGAGVREAIMIAVASTAGADEAAVLLAGLTYRIALFAALPLLYLGIRVLIRLTRPEQNAKRDDDVSQIETLKELP
jgi:uncharacterized protein (TIRG00374 family)